MFAALRKSAAPRECSRRRFGGAVLETVLVLPVLFYLAFGIVEFGFYFHVKHSLEGAARDGCRAAIPAGAVYSDVCGSASSAVETSMAASNLSSSGFTTVVKLNGTVVTSLSTAVAGDTITVTVTCTWSTAGQGYRPWSLIGGSKTLSGASVMRKEG